MLQMPTRSGRPGLRGASEDGAVARIGQDPWQVDLARGVDPKLPISGRKIEFEIYFEYIKDRFSGPSIGVDLSLPGSEATPSLP